VDAYSTFEATHELDLKIVPADSALRHALDLSARLSVWVSSTIVSQPDHPGRYTRKEREREKEIVNEREGERRGKRGRQQ